MLAVIRDVGFCSQNVGDLLLGARCDVLVLLELRNGRLVRAGNVVRRGLFFGVGHDEILRSVVSTAYADLTAAPGRPGGARGAARGSTSP
jgi:hypothetical protein